MEHSSLTNSFNDFFNSEKSSGILLIICTAATLFLVTLPTGMDYLEFWQKSAAPLTVEHWVNDGLMAVFFLLIGLELERELYSGELSDPAKAILPVFAALGGMVAPAVIHFFFNMSTPMRAGFGIPMATDIAFALGVLAILGKRIPSSLKVFVVAFAVIDDLGAIIIIAVFYTAHLSLNALAGALVIWALLFGLNRLRVMSLTPYVLGGVLMWFFMLKSGVHATIAGVMLAFAIPFSTRDNDTASPSHRLEHVLHKPVAFVILPIFALANTGVVIGEDWLHDLTSTNSLGIALGLLVGKPLGILLFSMAATGCGICRLPAELHWRHLTGAGMLGGIGFTMSILLPILPLRAMRK